MSASDLGGTLQFSTGGGDVNGNGLSSPNVTTDSGGGNVTLVFTQVPANLKIISTGETSPSCSRAAAPSYAITYITDGGDYSASGVRSATVRPTRSLWTAAAATSASRKAS